MQDPGPAARLAGEAAIAERQRRERLVILAHDLREPLSTMRMALEGMARSPAEAVHGGLRKVLAHQLDRSIHQLEDLLDRPSMGDGSRSRKDPRTSLWAVVDAAVHLLVDAMAQAGHTLRVEARQLLFVAGDRTHLIQIVTNLLENAIKYTPAGGSIDVELGEDRGDAVISISDSGCGMRPEMQERIFGHFAELGATADRVPCGLGLALTRRLIAQHDGSLTVHSDGVGRGSRFTVRLPASRELSVCDRPVPAGGKRPSLLGEA